MLTIYGFDMSAPTNTVRFTANALGLDYTYKALSPAAGEHQRSDYLQIHPAGKVPAIDDDGFRLFESGAIQRYLARKCESDLYPGELRAQALVDQWALFSAQHIGNAMGKVVFNKIIAPFVGAPPNTADIDEGVGLLERFVPIVDTQLGKSKFLAGESLSIADFPLLAWLDPAEMVEFDLGRYANVAEWRVRLRSASFYTDCHRSFADAFNR